MRRSRTGKSQDQAGEDGGRRSSAKGQDRKPSRREEVHGSEATGRKDRIHPLLQLQRSHGNQAVQRLVNDGIDRGGPTVRSERSDDTVPNPVEEVVRSSGRPLEPTTRAVAESRFGHDFSRVRVHTDEKAAESASAVNALAYTVGRDVVFSEAADTPPFDRGPELLAHELAHVVQQERGGASPPPPHGDRLERDAEGAASAFVADSGPVQVGGASAPGLARQPVSSLLSPDGREPRSLRESLSLDPERTNDEALEFEIGLIQAWLAANPTSPNAVRLLPELARLQAEKSRREGVSDAARARATAVAEAEAVLAGTETEADEGTAPAPQAVAPRSFTDEEIYAPLREHERREERDLWKATDVTMDTVPSLGRRTPPEELVFRYRSKYLLDEDSFVSELSKHLLRLLLSRGRHTFPLVMDVLEELRSDDLDDNVATAMVLKDEKGEVLDRLSDSPAGRTLLDRLYDHIWTGSLSGSDEQAAWRILAVKTRQIPLETYVQATQNRYTPIFPIRQMGLTVSNDSPVEASRLPNGNVRVRLMSRVQATREFEEDVRTLRGEVFRGEGLELRPDQIIGVRDYDLGGDVRFVPASALLMLSNKTETNTWGKIGTVSATAAGFGLFGAATGATGWGRVLVWADRVAMGVSALNTIVGEHRVWMTERLGRRFVRAVDVANNLVAVYGVGRLAGPVGYKLVKDIRGQWRTWRESGDLDRLAGTPGAKPIIDKLDNAIESLPTPHTPASVANPMSTASSDVSVSTVPPPVISPKVTPTTTTAPSNRGRPRTVRPGGGRGRFRRPPPTKAKGGSHVVGGRSASSGTKALRGGKSTVAPGKRLGGGGGAKQPTQKSPGAPVRGGRLPSPNASIRVGPHGTLIGRSEVQFRRDALRILRADKNHPLRFLLSKGRFRRTRGKKHSQLIDRPDFVQMGHVESAKGGGKRIVLQDAYLNQLDKVTIEDKRGVWRISMPVVDIGGIGVELRTAKLWEKAGKLPTGMKVDDLPTIDLSMLGP